MGLFVKMNPSDAPSDIPDVVLGIEKYNIHKFQSEVNKLELGDEISFTGRVEHMGDEFSYHSVRLTSLRKTGNKIDLQAIAYFTTDSKFVNELPSKRDFLEEEDTNAEDNQENEEVKEQVENEENEEEDENN